MSIQYSDPVELEARVVKLEQLLATLMQNGLNELSNARTLRFGEAGAMRLGPEGIVIATQPLALIGLNTLAAGAVGTGVLPALYWVYDWPTRASTVIGKAQGRLYGAVDATGNFTYVELLAETIANTYYSGLTAESSTNEAGVKYSRVFLLAKTPNNTLLSIGVRVSESSAGVPETRHVAVDGPFQFSNETADPTVGVLDGMLVYRSDTDVLRLRANGAWVNLLTNVSGAPIGADYLVGTANADLTGEIVVGATPGGELGGTWAAPTVDATHSGSSHAIAWAPAVTAQSAGYTAVKNDVVLCTGTFTVTLTAAATVATGGIIVVKNISTGTIMVDGNAAETIDGDLTFTLGAQASITLITNGSNWFII